MSKRAGWIDGGESDGIRATWRKFGPFALQAIIEVKEAGGKVRASWQIIDIESGEEYREERVSGAPSMSDLQALAMAGALAWLDSLRAELIAEPSKQRKGKQG